MIQGVVSRLAGQSFLIKGWSLTLTGVILGFAVDRDDRALGAVAVVPLVVFWGLDAHSLRAERLFRRLFDDVRKNTAPDEPFFMGATTRSYAVAKGETWLRTFRRGTVAWFYPMLLAATLIVTALLGEADA